MPNCITCELVAARDAGKAPVWDSIHRTLQWDLVHANNTSLPGWLVLVSRRHCASIDLLTPDEVSELGSLIRQASIALKLTVGSAKTYVMQFAERPDHPHVHFHIVPRMPEQPDAFLGPKVFGYLGVSDSQRVPESIMNELAARIREHFIP